MAGLGCTQPGGVWHNVNSKALSYSYLGMHGFGGAMHATACAGGLRHSTLLNHMPMVMGMSKADQSPYMGHMGGASWMDTMKNIFNTVVSGVRHANESGLTGAVGNLINRAVPKAPMPIEPGHVPGSNPGLNQDGVPAKRTRFGGGWF